MTLPPSLRHSTQHVCRLYQAIYSFKQTPKAWFEHFHSVFLALSLTKSSYDYTLFTCQTSRGLTLLLICMDNMIIFCDDEDVILSLKQHLQQ